MPCESTNKKCATNSDYGELSSVWVRACLCSLILDCLYMPLWCVPSGSLLQVQSHVSAAVKHCDCLLMCMGCFCPSRRRYAPCKCTMKEWVNTRTLPVIKVLQASFWADSAVPASARQAPRRADCWFVYLGAFKDGSIPEVALDAPPTRQRAFEETLSSRLGFAAGPCSRERIACLDRSLNRAWLVLPVACGLRAGLRFQMTSQSPACSTPVLIRPEAKASCKMPKVPVHV